MRPGSWLILAVAALAAASAASAEKCAFDHPKVNPHLHHEVKSAAAERSDYLLSASQKIQTSTTMRRNAPGATTIKYRIPVVFHVIHDARAETNVSEAALTTQIEVLNEDFNKNNADLGNLDSTFLGLEGSVNVEFYLGNVERYNSTSAACPENPATNGYAPAIPTQSALHFYSCDLGDELLGYAQFPGGDNATDVVVQNFFAIGRRTTNTKLPYELGRTATHEVGHWLGLRHIWGDGNCTVDDYIGDTPLANSSHYGCATSPIDSCGNRNMVQNFMDYQDDECLVIFTKKQAQRMRANFDDAFGWRRLLVVPDCGDGTVNSGEECDDGNAGVNDGCTMCRIATGWTCSGAPSQCVIDPAWSTIFHEAFDQNGPSNSWIKQSEPANAASEFKIDTTEFAGDISGNSGSWKADMASVSQYSFGVSPNISLPANTSAALSFWMKLDTEPGKETLRDCFDAVTVYVTDQNGNDIRIHADNLPYNNVGGGVEPVIRGWCSPNPTMVTEFSSFGVAQAALLGNPWVRVTADLSLFMGQEIKLAFITMTDESGASNAIWIDEVKVMAMSAPASTATGITTSAPTSSSSITTSTAALDAPANSDADAVRVSDSLLLISLVLIGANK